MKDKIWNLFKITGNINYYIMYKEMENIEKNEQNKSERNSNWRDKL